MIINMKKIGILGSTGSIGTQTLDIVRKEKDLKVVSMAAGSNVKLMEQQVREFRPQIVAMWTEEAAADLRTRLGDMPVRVVCGMEGLLEVSTVDEMEVLVTGIVGMIGIRPTIAAIEQGKTIALANKETLVTAGHIIMPLAAGKGVSILPVDSEHSAIFQSLNGEHKDEVHKLLITASGGPFRGKSRKDLESVTLEDTLKHPNWVMGQKITVDSATLVNKGLEVMEARWLFDVSLDQIQVVVQPQSVIHSMVEFKDGSVKAQLGLPDMRIPIRYALGLPGRLASESKKMTVSDYANLTFELPDYNKFPLLNTAYEAATRGGNAPCVMNAANEIAVAAFLQNKIKFIDIYKIIEQTLAWAPFVEAPGYLDYVNSNAEARAFAASLIK